MSGLLYSGASKQQITYFVGTVFVAMLSIAKRPLSSFGVKAAVFEGDL